MAKTTKQDMQATQGMEWIDIADVDELSGHKIESAMACGVTTEESARKMAKIFANRIKVCQDEGRTAL